MGRRLVLMEKSYDLIFGLFLVFLYQGVCRSEVILEEWVGWGGLTWSIIGRFPRNLNCRAGVCCRSRLGGIGGRRYSVLGGALSLFVDKFGRFCYRCT